MQKKERMQLIEVEPFVFSDKITKEPVNKIRHTFVLPPEEGDTKVRLINYYLADNGEGSPLEPYLRRLETRYEKDKSFEFFLDGRVWDDEIKWRLSPATPQE